MEYDIWQFYEYPSGKYNSRDTTTITGTLHEDNYIFFINSRLILLERKVFKYIHRRIQDTILRFNKCFRKF